MPAWHELLRQARRGQGLRQYTLAEEARVSLRTVTSYERGTAQPSRDTLLKLSTALRLGRETTNALLTEAGFDALPVGNLARFERRSLPFAAMQREIDGYNWPCLVMSDDMTILLWNAPATWVAELDFATALPDLAERTLMRVAALTHFRDRVLNWDEVISVMVALLKADFEDPARYAEVMPTFAKLAQDLATRPEYRDAFPQMMQIWQRVVPRQDVARTSFRADWQLADGTGLAFDCLLSSWNDFDAAWAFDWFPADGTTTAWLTEHPKPASLQASAQDAPGCVGQADEVAPTDWSSIFRSVREKSGLTQRALAQAVGVAEDTIGSFEQGRRRPSRAIVLRLARALHLDGATSNLLLTGAGHAPIASEIARSVAGLPSQDPRFRPERWQVLAASTAAKLNDLIAIHPWPCVVLDERCRPRATNAAAQRLLGAALKSETLLHLLVSRAFRDRVLNYNEVVSAIAPSDLKRLVAGAARTSRRAPLNELLDQLAAEDPEGFARLRAIWESAAEPALSTRATSPVLWKVDGVAILTFHGVLSLWSDYLWYWALDLHPADGVTWAWLETPVSA
jgi:transcriptional regulator with XRE-family HTH domain